MIIKPSEHLMYNLSVAIKDLDAEAQDCMLRFRKYRLGKDKRSLEAMDNWRMAYIELAKAVKGVTELENDFMKAVFEKGFSAKGNKLDEAFESFINELAEERKPKNEDPEPPPEPESIEQEVPKVKTKKK